MRYTLKRSPVKLQIITSFIYCYTNFNTKSVKKKVDKQKFYQQRESIEYFQEVLL